MSAQNDLVLSAAAATQLVPAGYAEKAMASLMQLHTELMDEKERRVDLFRRLMDREQALAELKMYVKLLEEKVATRPPDPPPPPPRISAPLAAPAPRPAPTPQPLRAAPRVHEQAPMPQAPLHPPPPAVPFVARAPRPASRPVHEGWKTW